MNTGNTRTSRRAFFLKGSATLGAVIATAAGATAHKPGAGARTTPDDVEAIRRVHLAFVAGVENQSREAALPTHHAYRANAFQELDAIKISDDRRHAAALWHVDVKVGVPLEGDSTTAQMARLQGMLTSVHWETGRLTARYMKVDGSWKIASLQYDAG